MKTNTRTVASIVMVAAVALSASPVSALWATDAKSRAEDAKSRMEDRQAAIAQRAEDRQSAMEEKRGEMQDKRQEQFCERFLGNVEQQKNRLEERYRNMEQVRTDRYDNTDKRRTERDSRLEEQRQTRNEYRDGWYAKLLELAGDDADKIAAVNEFKTTMEALVAARQASVDEALESFRAGVDTAVAGKKSGVDAAAEQFRAEYQAAIDAAKASCDEDGADVNSIRSQFMTDMKAAREKLQDSRKDLMTVGEQVRALAETKNAAIKTAMEKFRNGAADARADLKDAFGEEAASAGE